jgi:hypothetical protein
MHLPLSIAFQHILQRFVVASHNFYIAAQPITFSLDVGAILPYFLVFNYSVYLAVQDIYAELTSIFYGRWRVVAHNDRKVEPVRDKGLVGRFGNSISVINAPVTLHLGPSTLAFPRLVKGFKIVESHSFLFCPVQ